MRILIAARQALTRSALRLFLQKGQGLEVVGEAADSEELLAEVRSRHPNLLLLEWELPGPSTADLLATLRGANSRLTVVVLSGRPELEPAVRAAGADAFFNLGDPPQRFVATLQALKEGMPPE
jgi:two-component system, NarL family, invasion response regulator UvrY